MDEQDIDIPCPICSVSGTVKMIAHVDEIPYFGEHTQVTVQCYECGWRQTDFIPAEGKKPGGCSLFVNSSQRLSARVVRSSSCTVRIPELDLQVNPGGNSTGYVSNVEGSVFHEAQNALERIIDDEAMKCCAEMEKLSNRIEGGGGGKGQKEKKNSFGPFFLFSKIF